LVGAEKVWGWPRFQFKRVMLLEGVVLERNTLEEAPREIARLVEGEDNKEAKTQG
jgi:hypothetical protein